MPRKMYKIDFSIEKEHMFELLIETLASLMTQRILQTPEFLEDCSPVEKHKYGHIRACIRTKMIRNMYKVIEEANNKIEELNKTYEEKHNNTVQIMKNL